MSLAFPNDDEICDRCHRAFDSSDMSCPYCPKPPDPPPVKLDWKEMNMSQKAHALFEECVKSYKKLSNNKK